MAKKEKKNSRAARRGELDEELIVEPSRPEKDGKTRVMEELAERQTRINDSLTKPKSISKTKSRTKSKRDKRKAEKAAAFQDMLKEKVVQSTERHKKVKNYRKNDDPQE